MYVCYQQSLRKNPQNTPGDGPKPLSASSFAWIFPIGDAELAHWGHFPLLLSPFIFMHRSMQGATEYFRIPFDHAIEIGGHIEV